MRVVLLAHEKFPDRAKTAVGILRYGDHDVAAVLDRTQAGTRVVDHAGDLPDAPIVASMDEVDDPVDTLIIGIAPIGGGFEETWRSDVRTALERGCDIWAGLHYFLEDDEQFARLAQANGAELRDVRRPDPDIGVSEGRADEVSADVILTVGTDCSVGKMTTTMELVEAARDRGIDAVAIPTGQTGIMIEGWGHPVDRVPSDFTAGAVEEMVRATGDDHDLLVVEGQGSVAHPAYAAVTVGILHGAMPDKLVLCHEAGRESVHGYDQALPSPSAVVDLYERIAEPVRETTVCAGALNTAHLSSSAAETAIESYAKEIGAPATDPVRFDAAEILEGLR